MDSKDPAKLAPPPPGKVLLGDYVLGPAEEHAALWSTHLGWDRRHGDRPVRVIAIRSDVLPDGAVRAASASWSAMFESLRHPGLAPVIACGLQDNVYYVVTALVAGVTLEARIAEAPDRRLTLPETARVIRDIAEPLLWLHTRANPIVHEALDPRAVWLSGPTLDLCLANAGIAHAMRLAGLARVERPIPYSAPEQFDEDSPIGPAADQFVLASVAFECLTGAHAYGDGAEGTQALLGGYRPQLPTDIGDRRAGITRSLHRAWSRHPEVRYPSIAAFVTDFARSAGIADAASEKSQVRPVLDATLVGLQSPPARPEPASVRPAEIPPAPSLVADRPASAPVPIPTANVVAPPMTPARMPSPPPNAFRPAPALAPQVPAPQAFTPPAPTPQAPIQPATPAFNSPVAARSPVPAEPPGAIARPPKLRRAGLIAIAALLVLGGSLWLRSMLHRDGAPRHTTATPTVPPQTAPSGIPVVRAPTSAQPNVPTTQRDEHAQVPLPQPSRPSVPTQPLAVGAEPGAQSNTPDVRDTLQRGVDDCAARIGRYGRHVFVGVAYDRPNGGPIAVGIAGAPISASMRRCIQEVAETTRSPQRVTGRWQHSFYLRIP